jgi:hypothetical protein
MFLSHLHYSPELAGTWTSGWHSSFVEQISRIFYILLWRNVMKYSRIFTYETFRRQTTGLASRTSLTIQSLASSSLSLDRCHWTELQLHLGISYKTSCHKQPGDRRPTDGPLPAFSCTTLDDLSHGSHPSDRYREPPAL